MAIQISKNDFEKKFGIAVGNTKKDSGPGFLQRLKSSASEGLVKIKKGFKQAGDNKSANPLPILEGSLKIGAGAVETLFSPITAGIEPVVKPTIGKAVGYAADKLSDIPSVQRFANSGAGKMTSRVFEDVNDLNTIASAIAGQKGLSKTASSVGNAVAKTGQVIERAAQPVKGFVQGTKNLAGMIGEEAQRLPSRIATNVAEKQAIRASINKLPSKIAKQAAQDGIESGDIQSIYSIPKIQKAPLKQLATIVRDFAENKTTTNPIEVVGKPIINRFKQLEKAGETVGKKLGKMADDLGNVTADEVFPVVFKQLKKINGLSGLKVNAKGVLDFADTVLTTAETQADRAAIQRIFVDAIKSGTGKSKHLLRQELFEVLGGKKRSLSNLTATQEKAFQAIRAGLSEVLEGKNSTYKVLSNQYRKIVSPLESMRKLLKVAGEDADIMDLSAGLLARRITSAASSNPQIRAVLRAMDRATKTPGKAMISVENLQNFYNILEKYYDIAPKTGFQAQVKQGVEKAVSGPISYISEKINGLAGQTPVVRQKALEKVLEEVFR